MPEGLSQAGSEREPVRCLGCGRVRRPEGPLCPRCGTDLHEPVEESDVAEREWVEAY